MKKNRAISLEDLIPVIGEATLIYRRFRYKSDDGIHATVRDITLMAGSFYHIMAALALYTNDL